MSGYEASALPIVALYVVLRAWLDPTPRRVVARFGWLALASWLGEQSAIMAYDFYGYASCWRVMLGHVPVAVALIWPCVIYSAWDTSRALLRRAEARVPTPGGARAEPGTPRSGTLAIALGGGALVLADAALIEPIAVQAGLWSWHAPGLFGVPPIGLLGWAFHGAACTAVLELGARRSSPGLGAWADALVVPVAPVVTHALLLAGWWGLLRWLSVPLPSSLGWALAWPVGLLLVHQSRRRQWRMRLAWPLVWVRVPAALYFAVLLALFGRGSSALLAYAAAFVPPWLSLTARPRLDELRAGK